MNSKECAEAGESTVDIDTVTLAACSTLAVMNFLIPLLLLPITEAYFCDFSAGAAAGGVFILSFFKFTPKQGELRRQRRKKYLIIGILLRRLVKYTRHGVEIDLRHLQSRTLLFTIRLFPET